MAKISPAKAIAQLEATNTSWKMHAPTETFFRFKQTDFEAKIQVSRDLRVQIEQKELELKALKNQRDDADAENLQIEGEVVKGIVGNPDFGDDSSLYEGTGRIRKSERKTGRRGAAKPGTI